MDGPGLKGCGNLAAKQTGPFVVLLNCCMERLGLDNSIGLLRLCFEGQGSSHPFAIFPDVQHTIDHKWLAPYLINRKCSCIYYQESFGSGSNISHLMTP